MSDSTDKDQREKNWELVQIKAFTAWLNSYLSKRSLKIEDLSKDLQSGVNLCHFLELVQHKYRTKLPKWDKKPGRKVQKMENISIALSYIQNDMGVRLVGIGPEDIFSGYLKLILGLTWSLFRALRMADLTNDAAGGANKTLEEGLLKWVREQTEGYKGVDVQDFKYSFNDGLAFSALINKYDPTLLDYDSIDASDKEKVLNTVFEIAEKHLNIPKLLDVADLLGGDPDERSVQLYTSLFFHAFASKREEERLAAEKRGITSQMEELESKIESEAKHKEELLQEQQRLKEALAALEEETKSKGKQADDLEAARKKLQEEVDALQRRLDNFERYIHEEQELGQITRKLHALLSEEDTPENEEKVRKLKEEREERRKKLEQLKAQLDEEDERLLKGGKELREQREKLENEVESLTRRIREQRQGAQDKEELKKKLNSTHSDLEAKAAASAKIQAGWGLLKTNLDDHLEDLHCWREVQQTGDADPHGRIEVKGNRLNPDTRPKEYHKDLNNLNTKLDEENVRLLKSLKSKDIPKPREAVDKQGWLMKKGQEKSSSLKKRWFVLRGNVLSYYASENDTDEKGSISMESSTISPEKAEKGEKKWLLKVSVENRDLVLQAESKEDRNKWLCALRGAIAFTAYKKECEESDTRPDLRLLDFFTTESASALYLDDREISTDAVTALADILPYHDQLKVLSMEDTDLQDEEVKQLTESLKKLDQLHVLRLGKNKLSSASASHIAELLRINTSLKELHLNHNEIQDNGMKDLAESLKAHKSLQILDLTGNQVSNAGLGALAEALLAKEEEGAEKQQLQQLLLGSNNIQDEALGVLANFLAKNSSLKNLSLRGNHITDSGLAALAEGLKKNKSLESLDLAGNLLTNSGALIVRGLLEVTFAPPFFFSVLFVCIVLKFSTHSIIGEPGA
ncbi:Actinin, alpha 1 [Balamuthia mandrillaris]